MELLVVMAIISVLVALLMPAVQAAREAARRSKCLNNLHQLGVAMQSYLGVYKSFPPGGLSTSARSFGHAWLIRILPYIEEENIYNEFDQQSSVTGRLVSDALPWNRHNRDLLRGEDFPFMFCPSASSLERMSTTQFGAQSPNVMRPTYFGISGALDHPTTREKDPTGAPGKISWGGVILIDRSVNISDIRDGTTHTMMVAEQSGWCIDQTGANIDCRSDCGYGFPMGPADDISLGWERQFNVTCVIHPIGETSYLAYGVAGDCGPNRPIQSAHLGGAQVLMADGSGQWLSSDTDLQIVYNLANRDDGKRVSIGD